MKNFVLIFLISISGCNYKQENTAAGRQTNNIRCRSYPQPVTVLKIEKLYDSARWYIYAWHCDQPYIPKYNSSTKTTFGELPLKFNTATLNNDTLDIDFDFIDNGEIVQMGSVIGSDFIKTGVRFEMSSRKRIEMYSHSGYSSHFTGKFKQRCQPATTGSDIIYQHHLGSVRRLL